jgi:hypothetical protein
MTADRFALWAVSRKMPERVFFVFLFIAGRDLPPTGVGVGQERASTAVASTGRFADCR